MPDYFINAKVSREQLRAKNKETLMEVIVNAESLNDQDIAQIEDIVKRKTGEDISKIVISPVVLND